VVGITASPVAGTSAAFVFVGADASPPLDRSIAISGNIQYNKSEK